MKKLLTTGLILCTLSGCGTFMTGAKIIDPITGEVTYEESPMVSLVSAITGILGMGAMVIPAVRIAQNAARARNALYEANEAAIKDADWKQIDSAESFKALLKLKQDSHNDSVLLRKSYANYKKKKLLKKV